MARGMTKGDPATKTLQELYDQIKNDDAQKTAFVEAMKAGKAVDLLREQGCDVTAEELQEFLGYKANQLESLELSDSELKDVAGGTIVTEGLASLGDTCNCSNTCIRDCC